MGTVLIYGWSGRGNVGDELIKRALQEAFATHGLKPTFVDVIDASALHDVSVVVFGGGGILDGAPDVTQDALAAMQGGNPPVFYVGVGADAGVHPIHRSLMEVAKRITVRSTHMPDWLVDNAEVVPDLVYTLKPRVSTGVAKPNSVLVIPNVEVVPKHSDPHWRHIAWERFKDEFAQALDELVDRGSTISFQLMCRNTVQDDLWPATEIIARMDKRRTSFVFHRAESLDDIKKLVGQHSVVITQRYHGIVVCELTGIPYVSIDHHDKLKHAWPHRGVRTSYNGASKSQLLSAIEEAQQLVLDPYDAACSVYDDIVNMIVEEVNR